MSYPAAIKKAYKSFKAVSVERERIIAEFIKIGDLDRAKKMSNCGRTIVYGWNERKKAAGYVQGTFCDDRFCPSCQQQLHKERASQLSFMTKQYLPKDYQYRFWTFSPFTNCGLSVLRDNSRAVINVFNAVVKKFFSSDQGVIGYWRILEFTEHKRSEYEGKASFIDEISDDSVFHPHIHCLFAYKPDVKPYADVFAISSFIQEYLEKMKKTKDKRYQYFKSVGSSSGIVNYKVPKMSTAGFAFELCKYISLSKNLSCDNLKAFVAQVSSLQCFRHTGVLLWKKEYKEAYIEFIQNGNSKKQFRSKIKEMFCKFDKDNVYYLFSYKDGKFSISNYKPIYVLPPCSSVFEILEARGSPRLKTKYHKLKAQQSKFIQLKFIPFEKNNIRIGV